MDPAHADTRPGPVQLCVSECRPELRARSSQLYSFVVTTATTPHRSAPSYDVVNHAAQTKELHGSDITRTVASIKSDLYLFQTK